MYRANGVGSEAGHRASNLSSTLDGSASADTELDPVLGGLPIGGDEPQAGGGSSGGAVGRGARQRLRMRTEPTIRSISASRARLSHGTTSSRLLEMEKLERFTSVATEAEPEWLLAAHEVYPALAKPEIRAIRTMFEEYAEEMTTKTGEKRWTLGRDKLGEIHHKSLRSFFDVIDVDNSGCLDREELGQLVGTLSQPLSAVELDDLMDKLDIDGDGTVDFAEFQEWYQDTEDVDMELDDMFAQVDEDYSGRIDWSEFMQMIGRNIEHEGALAKSMSDVSGSSTPTSATSSASGGQGKVPSSPAKGGTKGVVQIKYREAPTMVRQALESVRKDIRAIYGTTAHEKTVLQLQSDEERRAAALHCFFRPDGVGWTVQFRKGWDIAQVFVLIYVALVVPFRIGFNVESKPEHFMFWVDVVVDVYFWFDIFLNFRTAYRDESGDLVIDIKLIRNRYLKTW
jgi:Ca2+-binding EF-hand superfamily protein